MDYKEALKEVENGNMVLYEDLKVGDYCKWYGGCDVYRVLEDDYSLFHPYKAEWVAVNCINVTTGEAERIGSDVPVVKVDFNPADEKRFWSECIVSDLISKGFKFDSQNEGRIWCDDANECEKIKAYFATTWLEYEVELNGIENVFNSDSDHSFDIIGLPM